MDRRFVLAALWYVLGCDGGSHGSADAAVDAYVNPLGRLCSATEPCPTGTECISANGSPRTFCSPPCTGTTDKTCGAGYSGPGKAACTIDRGGAGGPTQCGIVCSDPAGDVCSAATCNGMCPEPLVCGASGFAVCE